MAFRTLLSLATLAAVLALAVPAGAGGKHAGPRLTLMDRMRGRTGTMTTNRQGVTLTVRDRKGRVVKKVRQQNAFYGTMTSTERVRPDGTSSGDTVRNAWSSGQKDRVFVPFNGKGQQMGRVQLTTMPGRLPRVTVETMNARRQPRSTFSTDTASIPVLDPATVAADRAAKAVSTRAEPPHVKAGPEKLFDTPGMTARAPRAIPKATVETPAGEPPHRQPTRD
jgi:hypothetical protein